MKYLFSKPRIRGKSHFLLWGFLILFLVCQSVKAQETQIKGFVDFNAAGYKNDSLNFTLGEQDLFITSELSPHISFLGETVFRYSPNSPTKFDISVERIVINYNYYGNHNVLFGKHHTPVSYWNDTYHHGRVFFPTIFRPMMFDRGIMPLHTTGVRLQGQNLGDLRVGYDVLVGNGVASDDSKDFNKSKSLTAGISCKPMDRMKVGLSYYLDKIPANATLHHTTITTKVDVEQQLFSGYIAYFSNGFEFLGEGTYAINRNHLTGSPRSKVGYFYTGYRYKKFVPYLKAEYLDLSAYEVLFANNPQSNFLAGLRYEVNYLTVLKLEFAQTETHPTNGTKMKYNSVNFQFAVGF